MWRRKVVHVSVIERGPTAVWKFVQIMWLICMSIGPEKASLKCQINQNATILLNLRVHTHTLSITPIAAIYDSLPNSFFFHFSYKLLEFRTTSNGARYFLMLWNISHTYICMYIDIFFGTLYHKFHIGQRVQSSLSFVQIATQTDDYNVVESVSDERTSAPCGSVPK